MSLAVLCDFDHTITAEDATDALLEQYALPEWMEVEESWKKGHIGSRACMQQQIDLLRATPAQVDALADSIHIDPHFKSFAGVCARNNVPLIIVSDGLDYVIKQVLKRHGLSHLHVIASHLAHVKEDRWELSSPFANAGCSSQQSTCKCAISRQMRTLTNSSKILYVGDGRSDYCVSAEEADFILAKDSLLTYCQQQELPHQPFTTFSEASTLLTNYLEQHDLVFPPLTKEEIYA